MSFVKFTLSKVDGSKIDIRYKPFNLIHSNLWLKGIQSFIESGEKLDDCNRVYNFKDHVIELNQNINDCNSIIKEINLMNKLEIPIIDESNLQKSINHIHTYFADNKNQIDQNWTNLNSYLHGIEIIERSKSKKLKGQIFYNLPNLEVYDIPSDSYKFFTTRKHYGYCYANYPHVGRHIFEMFNAKDEEAEDDHIIPMNRISGGSYLWFGNTTPYIYDIKRKLEIRNWFKKNKMDQLLGMKWGDPKLAIGWLPVAKLITDIPKEDLVGLNRLEEIKILK